MYANMHTIILKKILFRLLAIFTHIYTQKREARQPPKLSKHTKERNMKKSSIILIHPTQYNNVLSLLYIERVEFLQLRL